MNNQKQEKIFYGKLHQEVVKTKADKALLTKDFSKMSQDEVLKALALGRRFN
jgi:hypothetical protein